MESLETGGPIGGGITSIRRATRRAREALERSDNPTIRENARRILEDADLLGDLRRPSSRPG